MDETVTRLTRERSRMAAILENMADGVLNRHFARIGAADQPGGQQAAQNQPTSRGASFAQMVRHHQIIELWQYCRSTGRMQAGAVEIDRQRIFWQVIITSRKRTTAAI